MKKWYESAFEKSYLERYAHRDQEEAALDVERILSLIEIQRTLPVLDLGCGAGRHLLALHAAGFTDLTGIDLSQDLLDVARQKLDAVDATGVTLVRSDMREIPATERFAAVLSMFTSFGYFDRDEENHRVFTAIHRALRPGGVLLMDTLNPPHIVSGLVPEEERTEGSQRVLIRRSITPDGKRVEKETLVKSPMADFVYRESVRMYTAEEMTALLTESGFGDIHTFGSLKGEAYRSESPRLVLTAQKESRS